MRDLRKYIFQIYGEPKAGKSTFASTFDGAMFICTEPGTKFLSVFGGDKVHETWEDIRDTVANLMSKDHEFQTIVFDTADNAWDMCAKYTNRKGGLEHESDGEYGKGWSAVKKEFKAVVDALANRGYGLIFISHSKTEEREHKGIKRAFINNTLGSGARKYINGLCDFIFHCYMDDDCNHLFRTKASLNVNAGDRSGVLPEVMPMDIEALKKALAVKWEGK